MRKLSCYSMKEEKLPNLEQPFIQQSLKKYKENIKKD